MSGSSDVRVVGNTFYAPAGDNIRIQSASSNVEVRDSILWAETGYDVYVANDSQGGFFSDYNDLHRTGAGRIFYWTKDFTDILDLQADVAAFDLHSVGATVVNPDWSEPQFYSRTLDDYHVFDLIGGRRFSSPTIDGGDPVTDQGLPVAAPATPPASTPAGYANLLGNPGFENGVAGWTVDVGAGTLNGSGASPAPFEGTTYFFAGPNAQGFADQTIDLLAAGFTTAQLDSGSFAVSFGGRIRSFSESVVDRGQIAVTFLDTTSQPIGAGLLAVASNATDRWELVGGHRTIPAGTRGVRCHFQADLSTGPNNDSYLDDAFLYVQPVTASVDQGAYGNTAAESVKSPPHAHRHALAGPLHRLGSSLRRTSSAGTLTTTSTTRRCESIFTRTRPTAHRSC